MSRVLSSPSLAATSSDARPRAAPIAGLRLDWPAAVLSVVFVGGLFLDGWAHNHGKTDDSFFTPWHGFFYSGFALLALLLVGVVALNRRRGYALAQAVPEGYRITLAGLLVFAAGGVGDLVWHTLFGIEKDVEALFSPTHLLLGVGIGLIVTGPLRAAWHRRTDESTWRALGPAVLSLTLLISGLTFFSMFSHPLTVLVAAKSNHIFNNDLGKVAGLTGMVLTAAVITGPLLLALRRWRLPPGAIAVLLAVNTIAMTVLDYEEPIVVWMAAAMIGAGLLADLLARRLRPRENVDGLRLLALLIPILLYSAYYAVLVPTVGTRWSVHMWTASIVLPGVACWLMSFLLVPPVIPEEA